MGTPYLKTRTKNVLAVEESSVSLFTQFYFGDDDYDVDFQMQGMHFILDGFPVSL